MLDLSSLPLAGLPYGWGRDWAWSLDNYRNMSGLFVVGEDMARADNRITLDPKVKDDLGVPVAHIHVDDHPNDTAMRKHAQDQAAKLFEGLGAKRVVRSRAI
jgi:hypothetical protein